MATTLAPSESYSITMRLEIQNKVGMLGKVTTAIVKRAAISGRRSPPRAHRGRER